MSVFGIDDATQLVRCGSADRLPGVYGHALQRGLLYNLHTLKSESGSWIFPQIPAEMMEWVCGMTDGSHHPFTEDAEEKFHAEFRRRFSYYGY